MTDMFSTELLNHPALQLTGGVLLHFLWQGLAVGFLALIAFCVLRNSTATARHNVALATLFVLAMCPLVTAALVRSQPDPPTDSPVAPETAAVGDPSFDPAQFAISEQPEVLPGLPEELGEISGSSADGGALSEPADTKAIVPWISIGWFGCVVLLSLRLSLSWFRAHRLTRHGLIAVSDAVAIRFEELCTRMGLNRAVGIFQSAIVLVPSTVGWLKPIVLLPATAITGLTHEQLTAVLAHELAHVRRHDYAINVLQGVIETLLFYHPTVWLVSRRIRIERENCCDDIAVAMTGEPTEYARALASLADTSAATGFAPAATGGDLVTRIRRVLGRSEPIARSRRTPRAAGVIVLATLVAICASLGSSHAETSQAQDRAEQTSNVAVDLSELPESPTWVFAKHVILSEGTKVVTLEEVDKVVAAMHTANQAGPEQRYATFRYTSGYLANDASRYRALDERFARYGNTVVSIQGLPTDRRHFDDMRTQADLEPDPKRKLVGRIVTPSGKRAENAEILLLPTTLPGEKHTVKVGSRRFGDQLGENIVRSKSWGFAIYPDENDKTVLAHHPAGFALTTVDAIRRKEPIRLQEWTVVRGGFKQPDKQHAIFRTYVGSQLELLHDNVRHAGLAAAFPKQRPFVTPPVGTLHVERWIHDLDPGGSRAAVPLAEYKPQPGAEIQVEIPGVSDKDRELGPLLAQVRRPTGLFLRFDRSSLDSYVDQLTRMQARLVAYFPETDRLVLLSDLNKAKPTVTDLQTRLGKGRGMAGSSDRAGFERTLFSRAGIDITKAEILPPVYPGGSILRPSGTLAEVMKAATDYQGLKRQQIQRTYLDVTLKAGDLVFNVTRQVSKPGAVAKKRPKWHIKWIEPTDSLDEYAKRLDFFGVEMGAMFADEDKLVYLSKFSQPKPQTRQVDTSKKGLPPASAKKRKKDVELYRRAGIDVSKATIVHVFPAETEGLLIRAERAMQNLPQEEIESTEFAVRKRPDGGYVFVVTRQVKKAAAPDVADISDTPTWVIAKHAIILEGKTVVDWDHIVRSLNELGTRDGKVKATFRFTHGARDKFQPMQQKVFKVLRNQPKDIPMSIGFGGRAGLDDVRTQADLEPDRNQRVLGRALTPDGKPAAGAEVVVLPPKKNTLSQFIYLTGSRLRSRTDHDFREAKPSGGFVVHPEPGSHVLVLHKTGFALLTDDEVRTAPTFRLKAWAIVSGNVAESPEYEQWITFTAQPKLPFSFLFYDLKPDADRNYETVVPPGPVAALRSVKTSPGKSHGRGVATWTLKPGEKKRFDLKPMTEYEIEGIELHKKQTKARRGGPKLSNEDIKRLRARAEIDRQKRDQREQEFKKEQERDKRERRQAAEGARAKKSEQLKRDKKELSGVADRVPGGLSTESNSIVGKVVWQGPIPKLRMLSTHKDESVFGNTVPDLSLLIDEKSKGIANAFVYLEKAPKGYLPPVEKLPNLKFGVKTNSFTPRAMLVRTGQKVQFFNRAATVVNMHTYPFRNPSVSMVVPPQRESEYATVTYRKPERTPVRVGCDFHTWMTGWHLPLDHPFAAVTDKDGQFQIKNLPPGAYKFKVWHEKVGRVASLDVTVPENPAARQTAHVIPLTPKLVIDHLISKHGNNSRPVDQFKQSLSTSVHSTDTATTDDDVQ